MKEKFKKIKEWMYLHPNQLVMVILGFVGLGLVTRYATQPKDEQTQLDMAVKTNYEPFDPGKDLDMQFVDPETQEVLGTIKVSESYMNDMMDIVSDDGTEKA